MSEEIRLTLTVKEVAKQFNVSGAMVYKLVREKKLSYYRIGSKIMIYLDSMMEFLGEVTVNREKKPPAESTPPADLLPLPSPTAGQRSAGRSRARKGSSPTPHQGAS